MNAKICRFCRSDLKYSFLNLGSSPLSNSYLDQDSLQKGEIYFPLNVLICHECFLVQLGEYESPSNIFTDYAYYSSFSSSWLRHSKNYVEMMIERFGYGANDLVIEVASNDGYLLQYFKDAGVGVLGIEPAKNVAKIAVDKGIPTLEIFLNEKSGNTIAKSGKVGDLIIGNNVLAHNPGLNDFIEGIKSILKPNGIVTLEFPHLLMLMKFNQFDTIYHEHFSYFSFLTVHNIFAHHGLRIFDVEELPTHGGSLRIYVCHGKNSSLSTRSVVVELLAKETEAGLATLDGYMSFTGKVEALKKRILSFLIETSNRKKKIAAYGAPAKGNTLLNYCGIRSDLIAYTVDISPHKQGHFLPGSRIPIFAPDYVRETQPDYLVILPWNIKDEIIEQMSYIREWGGKFVTFIPEVVIHD